MGFLLDGEIKLKVRCGTSLIPTLDEARLMWEITISWGDQIYSEKSVWTSLIQQLMVYDHSIVEKTYSPIWASLIYQVICYPVWDFSNTNVMGGDSASKFISTN